MLVYTNNWEARCYFYIYNTYQYELEEETIYWHIDN